MKKIETRKRIPIIINSQKQYYENGHMTKWVDVQPNPQQNFNDISTEQEHSFKTHTEAPRPPMATVITSIKSRGEGTDVKLHYEDLLMKTAVCWHKNRHTNPRNRIKGLEINPHSYSHHRHWSKDSLFNKCCLENWLFACRGMKTRSLPPCTKIH